jgi:lysyl-tRNA synthetase class I
LPAGYASVFRYSLYSPDLDTEAEASTFRPAFAHLALLVQVPGVDAQERVEAEKGSPLTARELEILDTRRRAAERWLESYAPERARVAVRRDGVPDEAGALDDDQRTYLASLAGVAASQQPTSGDAWQAAIFAVATEAGIPAGRAFQALYLAFLGRPNGPRAGWLLASLDAEFVLARLREAAGAVGSLA